MVQNEVFRHLILQEWKFNIWLWHILNSIYILYQFLETMIIKEYNWNTNLNTNLTLSVTNLSFDHFM